MTRIPVSGRFIPRGALNAVVICGLGHRQGNADGRPTGARSGSCHPRFGSWVIVTAIVIVVVAGVLGLLLGGRSAEVRTTTGLVSAFRFGSLGLIIIGTQLNGNPTYLAPAITFALVDFVLPLALAVEIGRGAPSSTPSSWPHQREPRS